MGAAELLAHDDVRTGVDEIIDSAVARAERRAAAAYGPDVHDLYDAMRRLLSGGKRLRAAFAYWSWRAHGGDGDGPDRERVLGVGAALELFQAAALFHDDVIDDSDTRRGLATAHVHFASVHAASEWPGDPARYGLASAVLLGDLALVASEELFGRCVAPLAAPVATRARAVFDEMRTEVTIGQYL
ncbi:MAG: polyprenyl synthetase family protein, partial [Cellulomonadaceae bacterium]